MTGAVSHAPAPAFVHDLNTCVGCHACVLACANEHQLAPGRSFRRVVSVNPGRRPDRPAFHLSLACHHCREAPCVAACPALAIARDARGAVVIDDAACIGCRYCSWVCPYDAPTFDHVRGVMEKCTFCTHRLADGLPPACVASCPTRALQVGTYAADAFRDVPGLPSTGAQPGISFVPLARPAFPGVRTLPAAAADLPAAPARVTPRGEWSLVVFTSLVVALVAAVVAVPFGGPAVPVIVLATTVALAAGASTRHLGRPERAWRAARNWRRSWLSREVLTFGGFAAAGLASSLASRAGVPAALATGAAAVLGVACLFSMDRVYAAVPGPRRARLDDGATMGGAAFLVAVLARWPMAAFGTGGLRVATAVSRWRAAGGRASAGTGLLWARLLMGIVAPLAAWAAGASSWAVFGLGVTGEVVDRMLFYQGLGRRAP